MSLSSRIDWVECDRSALEPEAGRPFEIALIQAGAVSAGAYTAGVADFLFEALDAWEQAKRERAGAVPGHRVLIRTIAGASAGGMTAAVTAVAATRTLAPVTRRPNAGRPAPDGGHRAIRSTMPGCTASTSWGCWMPAT